MIIKKPYAFLIRNFRLIHGLLFVILVYLAIRSINIYDFFSAYVSNHYYINQASLAANYVNIYMYVFTLLAIVISVIIYYILSIKNRENRFYLIVLLYYIILFAYYIYMHAIFTGLETKAMDSETQRAFRDISLIATLPQFVFIFITLLRTLGFNLKQFDFKKDLEELEIDTSDNEEVEVTLGTDTYKIARFFRKLLRLSKYFIIENKLFVISASSVIILAIGISIYSKIDVFGVTYTENQDVISSYLKYNVIESYITDSDYNNVVINKNRKYILVRVNISNISRASYTLDRNMFRLQTNSGLLTPIFGYQEKFSDLGTVFTPSNISSGTDKEVLILFEIDSKDESKDYIFKIRTESTKDRFKEIIIKPTDIRSSKDMGTFNLPTKVTLSDTIFKNTTLTVGTVEVADKFKEEYEYYVNNELKTGTKFILPESTNRGESLIIKIKTTLELDQESSLTKFINNPEDLFEKYGILRYRYQGNYVSVKLTKIKADYDKSNYAYLQIPKSIETANKIELILLIRGVKYTFILN